MASWSSKVVQQMWVLGMGMMLLLLLRLVEGTLVDNGGGGGWQLPCNGGVGRIWRHFLYLIRDTITFPTFRHLYL